MDLLHRPGPNLTRVDLQEEIADVLGRLIRFNTVNPPGDERACQEWLRGYLADAGFECEMVGASDERPNLVARLPGESDGPVLGYLSHVDTVLASPEDWSRDPWSGELHDGCVWGRGAIDMKSQTAAEVVAGAALAREGWRPPRGELKIMSVVDEEVGGNLGAQWLTRERPDLVRCDYVLNEGAGPVIPYGDRRLYGVCCAEKGTFRFAVRTSGRAGHASVPGLSENALLKLLPLVDRLGNGRAVYDLTEEPRAFITALGEDPEDPEAALRGIARDRPAAREDGRADAGSDLRADDHRGRLEDQRHPRPRRAQGRLPRAAGHGRRGDDGARAGGARRRRRRRGRVPRGGRSATAPPIESPLMDAIRDWVGEQDDRAPRSCRSCSPPSPTRAGSATRSPTASPTASSRMRHMTLYDTWPLMHGADERIDVRDLGFAAGFYYELPRRLLA